MFTGVDIEAILGIIMVFSVPLAAIFSFTYLRAKRMSMRSGELDSGDRKVMRALIAENEELRKRVENLEIIVSDPDLLLNSRASSYRNMPPLSK